MSGNDAKQFHTMTVSRTSCIERTVTIDCPGYEYHGRKARFLGKLLGDRRALLHIEDHIHVALPLMCVIVTPSEGVQPCL